MQVVSSLPAKHKGVKCSLPLRNVTILKCINKHLLLLINILYSSNCALGPSLHGWPACPTLQSMHFQVPNHWQPGHWPIVTVLETTEYSYTICHCLYSSQTLYMLGTVQHMSATMKVLLHQLSAACKVQVVSWWLL